MHWEPRGILRFLPTSTQKAHPREGPKVSTDMRRKDDPGNTKNARLVNAGPESNLDKETSG